MKNILKQVIPLAIIMSFTTPASALVLDLIESGDDPIADLTGALLGASSGISIVSGSESFIGLVGDGINPDTAQSATYTGLNLTSGGAGPNISNPDGIFLTSGVGNIPTTNTDTSFDNGSVGTPFPTTGGDADLSAILTAASAPSSTVNDVNIFEFDFTVDAGTTSIEADFVFGSDEFPDQGVTDIFAFIVDGTNFAFFQDGSLVNFVTGANADQFNDNGAGEYDLEYDGISNSLHVAGILDSALSTHTLKIAIGDTSDSIYDSGVFIGNLLAGTATGGGGVGPITPPNGIPEPASLALLGLGLAGIGFSRRKTK